MYTIYTDGSYIHSTGLGGYAAIIKKDNEIIKEVTGSCISKNRSANLIELLAVIEGFREIPPLPSCKVKIVSDSKYVTDGILYQGRKSHKKYWDRLFILSKNHSLKAEWVKGHNGHKENTDCDRLAKMAIKRLSLDKDDLIQLAAYKVFLSSSAEKLKSNKKKSKKKKTQY